MSLRAVRRVVIGSVLAAAVVLSGCGGGDPPPDLSARALEGRSLALSSGCSACHGKNGEGGVGPPWRGLAGSEVRFTDSTTAVADSTYLIESIQDPSARLREGYTVMMPRNGLTVEEIKKVVAYIQELE
ncbi:MAG: c-type cytochrome [Acidimicrobiales bacterium]